MSHIDAPPPTSAAAGGGYGPSRLSGDVRHAPAHFQDLTGRILEGEVIAHTDRGEARIRTSEGTLEAALRPLPPIGSKVRLEIQSAGGNLRILILAIMRPDGSNETAPAATQSSEEDAVITTGTPPTKPLTYKPSPLFQGIVSANQGAVVKDAPLKDQAQEKDMEKDKTGKEDNSEN